MVIDRLDYRLEMAEWYVGAETLNYEKTTVDAELREMPQSILYSMTDTISDTTERATPRNIWQPRATEVGLDKPIVQHRATPGNRSHRIVALIRSRVRAPSVALLNSA